MKIIGFSLIHNAIHGGFPIVEAVRAVQPHVDEVAVVDMASDDGTREVLDRLGVTVLDSPWSKAGDRTLKEAFALHEKLDADRVVFFEGDEVYDDRLVGRMCELFRQGEARLAVFRLQVEQNFQRVRWWPYPLMRGFARGGHDYQPSNTQFWAGGEGTLIGPEHGFLWDCANCFRDNWLPRIEQQAELFGNPRYLQVPTHFLEDVELPKEEALARLQAARWTWKTTPLDLPEILRPLVGKTRYEAKLD